MPDRETPDPTAALSRRTLLRRAALAAGGALAFAPHGPGGGPSAAHRANPGHTGR